MKCGVTVTINLMIVFNGTEGTLYNQAFLISTPFYTTTTTTVLLYLVCRVVEWMEEGKKLLVWSIRSCTFHSASASQKE